MEVIGVVGGTFDPVHVGHLRLALEVREGLGLDRVHLIPASTPPHRRAPVASAEVRRRMLAAAVRGSPELEMDERELNRPGPSYTVDTLNSLREDFPDRALCLILGMDAFSGLASWHRWDELLELAHIGVAQRPGTPAPREGEVAKLLDERRVTDPARLREARAGLICLCEIPALEISGSRIRRLIAEGRNPRYLVPDPALQIIQEDGIYLD